MGELTPLGNLIPGWPAAAPQFGNELIVLDDDELNDFDETTAALVRTVRSHMRLASIARGQSTQLSTPGQIARALDGGEIRLITKRWLTLVLDSHHRRVFAAVNGGQSRQVSRISRFVPDASELPQLPKDGAYLILFGGSPWVLDIDDARQRLVALSRAVPLVDIVFRHSQPGKPSQFWSVRSKVGKQGSDAIAFPDRAKAEEVYVW